VIKQNLGTDEVELMRQSGFGTHSIVTCISAYRRCLAWLIGFIEPLQKVTTSNYTAIANSHTLSTSLQ
jgi:hypothetical protein